MADTLYLLITYLVLDCPFQQRNEIFKTRYVPLILFYVTFLLMKLSVIYVGPEK